jgi:hypothetical protein
MEMWSEKSETICIAGSKKVGASELLKTVASGHWGITGPLCSWGIWFFMLEVGHKVDEIHLKKRIWCEIRGIKLGSNLTEYSKEGYGFKKCCFANDDAYCYDVR